jgi:hypothetical protein
MGEKAKVRHLDLPILCNFKHVCSNLIMFFQMGWPEELPEPVKAALELRLFRALFWPHQGVC